MCITICYKRAKTVTFREVCDGMSHHKITPNYKHLAKSTEKSYPERNILPAKSTYILVEGRGYYYSIYFSISL